MDDARTLPGYVFKNGTGKKRAVPQLAGRRAGSAHTDKNSQSADHAPGDGERGAMYWVDNYVQEKELTEKDIYNNFRNISSR